VVIHDFSKTLFQLAPVQTSRISRTTNIISSSPTDPSQFDFQLVLRQ